MRVAVPFFVLRLTLPRVNELPGVPAAPTVRLAVAMLEAPLASAPRKLKESGPA